jgi:hypothetical protein
MRLILEWHKDPIPKIIVIPHSQLFLMLEAADHLNYPELITYLIERIAWMGNYAPTDGKLLRDAFFPPAFLRDENEKEDIELPSL